MYSGTQGKKLQVHISKFNYFTLVVPNLLSFPVDLTLESITWYYKHVEVLNITIGTLKQPTTATATRTSTTKCLMRRRMAVRVRYNSWYISLLSSAKHQGRRLEENEFIFYRRISHMPRSVQYVYRSQNLLKLNMQCQRTIPKGKYEK